jgi:cyclophilin family peptidyl-prolyl cis-trans isomerase
MPRTYANPPAFALNLARRYVAAIDTPRGVIRAELFAKDAPKTVNHFVFLAREGFYDGLTFHNVIPDFVVQAGCPLGTGAGGCGYTIPDEIGPGKPKHLAGTLFMSGAVPNANGSVFSVAHADAPWLDGRHTTFGKVADADSMRTVFLIRRGDVIRSIRIDEA